jgi:hypothetical protein
MPVQSFDDDAYGLCTGLDPASQVSMKSIQTYITALSNVGFTANKNFAINKSAATYCTIVVNGSSTYTVNYPNPMVDTGGDSMILVGIVGADTFIAVNTQDNTIYYSILTPGLTSGSFGTVYTVATPIPNTTVSTRVYADTSGIILAVMDSNGYTRSVGTVVGGYTSFVVGATPTWTTFVSDATNRGAAFIPGRIVGTYYVIRYRQDQFNSTIDSTPITLPSIGGAWTVRTPLTGSIGMGFHQNSNRFNHVVPTYFPYTDNGGNTKTTSDFITHNTNTNFTATQLSAMNAFNATQWAVKSLTDFQYYVYTMGATTFTLAATYSWRCPPQTDSDYGTTTLRVAKPNEIILFCVKSSEYWVSPRYLTAPVT